MEKRDLISEYEREAYARGQADYYNRGLQLDKNPYANDYATTAAAEWIAGWRNEKELDDAENV